MTMELAALVHIDVTINGVAHSLDVAPNESLAHLLRERLHLTGTKLGCGSGTCGSCAVHIDGCLKNACITLGALVDECTVTTIEGLADGKTLHPVQEAFVTHGAVQCGYCTPGMVMAAVSLLMENPDPTERQIRLALAGNLCRCTGYVKIISAVRSVAETMAASAAATSAVEASAPQTADNLGTL